jgi:hypothetical protein
LSAARDPDFLRDIERLKAEISISSVIGETVKLARRGREYEALCPFHDERTPSFTVVDRERFFHCFGCGAHGDVFDWLDRTRDMSLPQAVAYLSGETGTGQARFAPPQPDLAQAEPIWIPIIPVPDDAPTLLRPDGKTVELINPKRAGEPNDCTSFRPAMSWQYRSTEGRLLGYVLRIEFQRDGRRHKITPQITFCIGPGGERQWCLAPFPYPRPLYGLEELAARPDAPVLVVEGEKACDAGRVLIPRFVVVTWPGGSKAIARVDWSRLSARDILLLPDADKPGREAIDGRIDHRGERIPGIVELLRPIARRVRVVEPPKDLPEGWDLADAEGWSEADGLSWLLAHAREAAAGIIPTEEKLKPCGMPLLSVRSGLPDFPKWLPLFGEIEGEARGQGLGRVASYLLRHYCDPSLVVGLTADWNTAHCRPPIPAPDLVSVVERCAGWELERRSRRHAQQ